MASGTAIARVVKIEPQLFEEEFRHSVTVFRGGAILSAVAINIVA